MWNKLIRFSAAGPQPKSLPLTGNLGSFLGKPLISFSLHHQHIHIYRLISSHGLQQLMFTPPPECTDDGLDVRTGERKPFNTLKSWAPKNWCFWTGVLEKTLESPSDCKEIQPGHSEGDQPWDFFGRNDAKAESPVLWPPHVKSWLIGKDSDAGRDWEQEEKGTTEDEMAGWHQWLNGHESEWTPGVGDGQGGLACCSSWGPQERTWLSGWTELNIMVTDITEIHIDLVKSMYFFHYIMLFWLLKML